jgi:transcriptional regulator with XRE-family HTH domain
MTNHTIGRNIANLRKLKGIKAYEMAKCLNMKESTYTKYERGETAITIEFVDRVASVLNIEPLLVLTFSPTTILDSFSHSSQSNSVKPNTEMLAIIEGIISLNQKLTLVLENK